MMSARFGGNRKDDTRIYVKLRGGTGITVRLPYCWAVREISPTLNSSSLHLHGSVTPCDLASFPDDVQSKLSDLLNAQILPGGVIDLELRVVACSYLNQQHRPQSSLRLASRKRQRDAAAPLVKTLAAADRLQSGDIRTLALQAETTLTN